MTFIISTPSEVMEILGSRLRAHRLAQQLSQHELAGMAGLSLGALRKLERDGQCSLETLIRVAQALGLVGELDELFMLKPQSISQMEMVEMVRQRQRAPRRKSP